MNWKDHVPLVPASALAELRQKNERLRKALEYCAYPENLHPLQQAAYLVARRALELTK